MKILVCDQISPKGIELFKQRPEFQVTVLEKRLSEAELLPIVGEVEAMVVRSETKVAKKVLEAATKLRVVGRAGVGVDNVDVEAATDWLQCWSPPLSLGQKRELEGLGQDGQRLAVELVLGVVVVVLDERRAVAVAAVLVVLVCLAHRVTSRPSRRWARRPACG